MDKYTLRLVALTETDLEDKISKVPDPDRLTTVFTNSQVDQPESYSSADAIFINYRQATKDLETILENIASYTRIIILADDTFQESDGFLQYDIWDTQERTILNRISAFKQNMKTSLDLELKENQLYTLIDSVPDLIWYKDLEGLHIDVNEPFCDSVDKTRKEIKYRDQGFIMGLTPEEFANGEFACVTTDNIVIKEQDTSLFDEKVLIHGEMRQFKTYKTALRGRSGESIGTVGVAHDVTEIWNTHEEFRLVISRLPFPMIITDKNHKLVSYNDKFSQFFHRNEESLEQFDFNEFANQAFGRDITLPESKNATVEAQVVNDGKTYHILIEKSEITDVFGEISGYFYSFRDFTKTYEYEEQLRLMAETDELTQIYNRKFIREFFETKLRVFVKEKLTFAVAIIDIDYFKNYNDHYGHIEGDAVIKEIASILKLHSDNKKVFVARFGGEEFIVMAIDKTQGEVKGLLAALQKELKVANIPHEKSLVSDSLTMSIGCYYLDELENGMHLADLVEVADKYLYEAKEQGRNRMISNIPENVPVISLEAQKKESYDELTNTLNQKAMKVAGVDILSHSSDEEKHALFSINLDDFKNVNSTFGEEFGDVVLAEIGKRLCDSVRQHDLVGRVEGDEFVIFLRDIPNIEMLMNKAIMIQSRICRDVTDDVNSHSIQGSFGIAVYPEHGTTYEELCQHAGLALKRSKQLGKHAVSMYDETMK